MSAKRVEGLLLVVDLGLRLADAHDPAEPSAHLLAAAATDPDEDADDETKGRNENTLSTDVVLGLVPVTCTLCSSRRAKGGVVQRGRDLRGVGEPPLSSLPLTAPVEVIVAVETLFVVTSLTKRCS
jgi:hypothetical protein